MRRGCLHRSKIRSLKTSLRTAGLLLALGITYSAVSVGGDDKKKAAPPPPHNAAPGGHPGAPGGRSKPRAVRAVGAPHGPTTNAPHGPMANGPHGPTTGAPNAGGAGRPTTANPGGGMGHPTTSNPGGAGHPGGAGGPGAAPPRCCGWRRASRRSGRSWWCAPGWRRPRRGTSGRTGRRWNARRWTRRRSERSDSFENLRRSSDARGWS